MGTYKLPWPHPVSAAQPPWDVKDKDIRNEGQCPHLGKKNISETTLAGRRNADGKPPHLCVKPEGETYRTRPTSSDISCRNYCSQNGDLLEESKQENFSKNL